jgi:hypothetical protein
LSDDVEVEAAIAHIYEGEFGKLTHRAGRGRWVITGGGHSDYFVERAAEHGIVPIKVDVLPNGVRRVVFKTTDLSLNQLNQMQAFAETNPNYIPGGKTIFPQNWTKKMVIRAVYDLISMAPADSASIMSEIDGVKILANFNKGLIRTAFPYWDQ